MIDLPALHAAIQDGTDLSDPRQQRLLDALRDPSASGQDIAPLLRQIVMSAKAHYTQASLTVPSRPGLAEACALSALPTQPFGVDQLRVGAPVNVEFDWLDGRSSWIDLATIAPGEFASGDEWVPTLSRQQRPVSADPMFERLTGFASHPMPEQREAVRQVMLAPPGAVTHVVLPTGAGKSIVGLLPALADSRHQVIVVVPTVAIALDQERVIREASSAGSAWAGIPTEVAWYGDLPNEQRSTIRDRLLDGTQRVLFTSPESMVTSLEPTLLAAAARGHVHTLVFDEAHLISAWGLDFRPEMQLVASVRQQLLEATSRAGHEAIRTVLLTATLDSQALQLNAALFPSDDDLRVVGAPALRTEPRFLRVQVQDNEQRFLRLSQLLRVAPRPAIVYATKIRTAEAAYESLRAEGFQRVALFTGDTDSPSRQDILDGWRGGRGATRYDVVVGTAAFGLGVDQSNVRTIIHVEAPASVGSYYQEVGRGGRDGHACVAILLAHHEDLQNTRVGDFTILTPEKAWNRWSAMATTRSHDLPVTVDVTVLPAHISRASEANELWNKNTLILLERARLLRVHPRPVPEPGAHDGAWEDRRGRVAIEFVHDEKLSFDVIRAGIHRVAVELLADRIDDRAAVEDLIAGQRCFGKLFAHAYTFDIDAHRVRSRPTPACSGCPGCQRPSLRASDPPTAAFFPPKALQVAPVLARIVGEESTLVVHDQVDWLHRHGPELLTRLVNAGCRHLYLADQDRRLGRALERLPYVAVDQRPEGYQPFVRPSIIWRPRIVRTGWKRGGAPVRIIVVESGRISAPDRADQTLENWWAPARHARRLLEQL